MRTNTALKSLNGMNEPHRRERKKTQGGQNVQGNKQQDKQALIRISTIVSKSVTDR